MSFQSWLYHKSLGAKVFQSKESFDQALKDGWVDSPSKLEAQDAKLVEETQHSEDQKPDAQADEQTASKPEAGQELKKADFATKSVKELKDYLLEKGKTEKELKGLKKDELISLIGDIE